MALHASGVLKGEGVVKAELVIFDLDGTLVDSSGDIAWAANRTLREMGYGEMPAEDIKARIGWGVTSLLDKVLPEEARSDLDRAKRIFLGYYGEHLLVETEPYPGTLDTLRHIDLTGRKMAVATNKPVELAERIIEGLGMKRYFGVVIGGDSVSNKKPHPEPLLAAIDVIGATRDETVFVGDSAIDCEAGRRAGVRTIGAGYGFRGREALKGCGCELVIDRIDELKEILSF